jgi:hypothetical protein
MAVGITIVLARFAIERGRNSSLVTELLCSDFGIIRFGKNSRAFCGRSGLHSKSVAGIIPHLNPLPLAKGEANFIPWSFARIGNQAWPRCAFIAATRREERGKEF